MVQEGTSGGRSPITPMPTFPATGNTSEPPFTSTPFRTPIVREVIQTKPTTEVTESEEEEYELFKEFKKMRDGKKQKEAKMKECEEELEHMSLHTWSDSGSGTDGAKHKKARRRKRRRDQLKKLKKTLRGSEAGGKSDTRVGGSGLSNPRLKSPFTDDINETQIPPGLKGPRVKSYDGTGDPDDHVANFQWAIKMIPMDPKLWCLYFAGTLDGSARYWLDSLPQRSVPDFDDLTTKFCKSFVQQRKYQSQAHSIMSCRQREGESNKSYFKRFNDLSRRMPTRDDPMITAAFVHGLREGELFRELVKKEFRTAEEMITEVNKTLRQEEESAEKLRLQAQEKKEKTNGNTEKRFPSKTNV